ncbi:MAG: alpha/beta hydrolase [Cyclobacteriaceae bacterium]
MRFTYNRFLILPLLPFLLSGCAKDYAEYIEKKARHDYRVEKDIHWASPDGIELTMDIYTPNAGKKSYPVIIMFHGGAWMLNTNEIMDEPSAYLASQAEYVICNVNYRLLPQSNNTVKINEIIEDAFGAVLWVKHHIEEYQGDPEQIIVTGDSAGGHLASMILLGGDNLSSKNFQQGVLAFTPSWLPDGKTAEQIKAENGLEVQAGIINYGAVSVYNKVKNEAFEEQNLFWKQANTQARGFFGDSIDIGDHPEYYRAVSPVSIVPSSNEKPLPPLFLTVGSEDRLVTPEMVRSYQDTLIATGHSDAELWVHQGRPHAFLDSGSNFFLGTNFRKDAVPALNRMIHFLNNIFY